MKILIIDDEKNICISLKNILDDEGYTTQWINSCKEAYRLLDDFEPELIILDVKLKDENGLDFLEDIKNKKFDIPVIMISGHSGIREAVQAMKVGAFDFLEKPLNLTRVKLTVLNALDFYKLRNDYRRLKTDFAEHYKIIGKSDALLSTLELIKKLAKTNSRVLIRGESGTGKELFAYALHHMSIRKEQPFIKFNSAAIPSELVESELFGYEKGAFTGAIKSKKGKIELADGGTLFLDEIGDMSLSAQAKILRVLQEGELQRVGSNNTIKVDTRIIAATHKNLEEMVSNGNFREDLFYRLNVVPVICPPLRERKDDIPILIEYFTQKFSSELNIKLKSFSTEALEYLQQWDFPGNIRELKNLIERLYILIDSELIDKNDLIPHHSIEKREIDDDFWIETKLFNDKKLDFETKYLSTQLKLNDYCISKTANLLGLQQSNLSRKLKELNINPKEEK
ncbi:MAG: sigma-54 dependent transcriptional regulator [Candidatus Cloacimonetes bacterium]|nr:sigma-54 dependent transcriptional regulator [Candidatus Cloacimonadota bacterium]MDD4155060.1 sigma-54 dependent transcriptional regulator [Candidatus Cloacimonadota bacterium]